MESTEKMVYGQHNGFYDPEVIEGLEDWNLFLEYYNITQMAWRLNHTASIFLARGSSLGGEIDKMIADYNKLQYPIDYLLYQISKRNGIEVNEPDGVNRIKPDREVFMKWYRFYDNHFMHELTDQEFRDFERKREAGEDVTEYLPKGDWRSYESAN